MDKHINHTPKIGEEYTHKLRRWTQAAVECYQRGCRCGGCYYNDFFAGSPQRCQMKTAVLELVRTIGKPDIDIQKEDIINDF